METFDQKLYPSIDAVPCEVCVLRGDLIKEESCEYHGSDPHSVDELDALVDLLYVVVGTNLALNITVEPYSSSQLKTWVKGKFTLWPAVNPMIADLYSRFPCPKIQHKTSNALIQQTINTGSWMGYDLREAFNAVHNANMKKLWTEEDPDPLSQPYAAQVGSIATKANGFLVKRKDGKVLKPPSFKPADLTLFLRG